MTRSPKSRSTVLCACLAVLALLAPASALAGPSAGEEYVLTLPGTDQKDISADVPTTGSSDDAGPLGVVGEQDDGLTSLGALGAAVLTPAGAGVLLLLAGGLALALRRREDSA